MVQITKERFGRLDILVNNAAITFIGDLGIPLKRYDLVMQVNLPRPSSPSGRPRPSWRGRGGSIINVSSEAALYPHPSLLAYGISKIGLERLTVDAARQLAPSHIAVNCFRIDIAVALGGVRGQHARRRPLRLGTVRGGGRRHRVDGAPARHLLGPPREHARTAAPRGDHGVTAGPPDHACAPHRAVRRAGPGVGPTSSRSPTRRRASDEAGEKR